MFDQGKIFKIFLCGSQIYSCSNCRSHLAKHDQIVSKVRKHAPEFVIHFELRNVPQTGFSG